MNRRPEKNSQEAGMDQSNEGWRGKGRKRFLKRHEKNKNLLLHRVM
jgi:hypothetical protein